MPTLLYENIYLSLMPKSFWGIFLQQLRLYYSSTYPPRNFRLNTFYAKTAIGHSVTEKFSFNINIHHIHMPFNPRHFQKRIYSYRLCVCQRTVLR